MRRKHTFKNVMAVIFTAFFLTMAGCDFIDPFYIQVAFIEGVPETGEAGTPLTLTGTIKPAFASNKDIIWFVINAGTTGASISENILNTAAGGIVIIRAIIINGIAKGKDFTQDFEIVFTTGGAASNTYTVTFETNGGGDIAPQFVAEGQTAQKPDDPVKSGFDFVNWYDNEDLTDPPYSFDTPVTEDITLYAYWIEHGTAVSVTGVSLNKTNTSLTVGATETLTATISPYNATNRAVSWSSSNYAVATVSTTGFVTAVSAGAADITVTTADGGFTATCAVTVQAGNITSPIEIEMVSIPAGTFIMGSPTNEPDRNSNGNSNETQHSITLSGFSMSKYQVTQNQWVAVMGAGEDRTTTGYGKGDNYPVYYVSWYDAIVFCNKLSMKEGLNPVYNIGGSTNPADWGTIPTGNNAAWNAAVMDMSKNGYRLPTEAEWEYACRGSYPNKATETNTKPFGIGDGTKMISGMANFDGGYPYDLAHSGAYTDASGTYLGKTTAVGSYQPNNYGLYDMHGNLYEWCWDWFDLNYYSTSPSSNPTGAFSGTERVHRGGYWFNSGRYVRSAYRDFWHPYSREYYNGIRLVRSGGGTPTVPVTGVTLNKTSLSLIVGNTETLTAAVQPSNATNKNVTWTSGTPAVATVNSTSGLVTAVSAGNATITVTTTNGGFTATCTVTVQAAAVSVGIEMVPIPAGTFIMGSPTTEPYRYNNEGPQHSVTLSGFSMSKYQVTQKQWFAVMGKTIMEQQALATTLTTDYGRGDNYPVYYVSWYEALVFCNKLSVMEGLNPVYSIGSSTDPADWGAIPTSSNSTWDATVMDKSKNGYRLPTEAEWEYACRAGTTTAYNTGDTFSDNTGWYSNNSGNKTHEVGLKAINNWGLYDMCGNLYEMCWDWIDSNYYSSSPVNNPVGPETGSLRVQRGGSWYHDGTNMRSAYRSSSLTTRGNADFGIRLVRSGE